jgi:uncharacterized protein YbaR (Trm112 family)
MPQRTLTPEDLILLACPVCHQALQLELSYVVCTGCARRYPVIDGIPILLAERAC